MYERPEINDEELGIRACQLRRAQAVERAIQRVRHGLEGGWKELTSEEIEELEWVLGELWAYLSHAVWDDLHFGLLDLHDVLKILTFGSQLRRHARASIEILRDVEAVIEAKTPYSEPEDAESEF
jgi:hypothetical protein